MRMPYWWKIFNLTGYPAPYMLTEHHRKQQKSSAFQLHSVPGADNREIEYVL